MLKFFLKFHPSVRWILFVIPSDMRRSENESMFHRFGLMRKSSIPHWQRHVFSFRNSFRNSSKFLKKCLGITWVTSRFVCLCYISFVYCMKTYVYFLYILFYQTILFNVFFFSIYVYIYIHKYILYIYILHIHI